MIKLVFQIYELNQIIILYELDNLKTIKKYITKWNIKEEEYTKVVLTDVFEIYIIELPKFNKYKEKYDHRNNILNSWIKFIENPEVIDMENVDTSIKKARKVLEDISSSEYEIRIAELREKHIMDQKAIEEAGFDKGLKKGKSLGLAEGKELGIKEGKNIGIKENQISIAKKMKEKKFDIKIISEITGLSIKEIESLD